MLSIQIQFKKYLMCIFKSFVFLFACRGRLQKDWITNIHTLTMMTRTNTQNYRITNTPNSFNHSLSPPPIKAHHVLPPPSAPWVSDPLYWTRYAGFE